MGIHDFYSRIFNKHFGHVVAKQIPATAASLLVDVNSLLHAVAQIVFQYGNYVLPEHKVLKMRERLLKWRERRLRAGTDVEKVEQTYQEMLEAVNRRVTTPIVIKDEEHWEELLLQYEKVLYSHLGRLLLTYQPQITLVLAVDGVPPQAKLIQQRSRRFRSKLKSSQKFPYKYFHSSLITPGTDFMDRVDQMFQRWIKEPSNVKKVGRIIYSGPYIPGEGEHKIMDYIRQGEVYGNGDHIILGLDSDLIMLSIIAPIKNLILVREQDPFDPYYVVKEAIYVESFKQSLLEINVAPDDFVLAFMVLGNDFLPHQPALNNPRSDGLDIIKAIQTVTTKGRLVENGEIVWDRLYRFFDYLRIREPEMIERDLADRSKRVYRVLGVTESVTKIGETINSLNYTTFRNAWYTNALGPRSDRREDAELFELVMGRSYQLYNQDVNTMVVDYLRTMVWTYKYYTKGLSSVRWDWFYPHHHTPLFSDLSHKLDQTSRQMVALTGWQATQTSQALAKRFLPIHQAISVIPVFNNKILDKKYRTYQRKQFNDYFPVDYLIEKDGLVGKTNKSQGNEYKATIMIPFFLAGRIVDSVILKTETIEKYILDEAGKARKDVTASIKDEYSLYIKAIKTRSRPHRYQRFGRPNRKPITFDKTRVQHPSIKRPIGAKIFEWKA